MSELLERGTIAYMATFRKLHSLTMQKCSSEIALSDGYLKEIQRKCMFIDHILFSMGILNDAIRKNKPSNIFLPIYLGIVKGIKIEEGNFPDYYKLPDDSEFTMGKLTILGLSEILLQHITLTQQRDFQSMKQIIVNNRKDT